jgi:mRNA degradation ribonuclease J1/J2
MVRLTFYGGVDEIGGNKILLEDSGTKIFLDFGQSFTFGSEFFTSWLQPRGSFSELTAQTCKQSNEKENITSDLIKSAFFFPKRR